MTTLCFLDTETTGLHPELHHVWEVGLIVRRDGEEEQEYLWQLAVDLSTADPFALGIGGYWDRRRPEANNESQVKESLAGGPPNLWAVPLVAREAWCDRFRELTHGAHLVGNVVSFDAERLAALLRWEGRMPTWHYHLVDIEAMVAGLMGFAPPWSSEELSKAIGVEMPSDADRHTALGDARWAAALYDAVLLRAASTQAQAAENGTTPELADAVEFARGFLPADESDNSPVAVPADVLRTLIREGRE